MFEIFNFPGIELIGFILILGTAIIIDKILQRGELDLVDEIERDLVDEMERED